MEFEKSKFFLKNYKQFNLVKELIEKDKFLEKSVIYTLEIKDIKILTSKFTTSIIEYVSLMAILNTINGINKNYFKPIKQQPMVFSEKELEKNITYNIENLKKVCNGSKLYIVSNVNQYKDLFVYTNTTIHLDKDGSKLASGLHNYLIPFKNNHNIMDIHNCNSNIDNNNNNCNKRILLSKI